MNELNKILIFGASGYLGGKLFRDSLREKVIGTFYKHCDTSLVFFDLSEQSMLSSFLQNFQPDIILFAAGLTDVDECQRQPELAFQLNHKAVEIITSSTNAKIIYYSTDYVFDGKQGNYDEDAQPNPLNVYGQSKLLGELAVLSSNPNNAVIRVSGLYGVSGVSNDRFKRIISSVDTIFAEDDRFSSPIHLDDVISATRIITENNLSGIFHVSGPTILSRYEFHQLAAYHLPSPRMIVPVCDYSNRVAPRPKNTTLISRRLSNYNWDPQPVTHALSKEANKLADHQITCHNDSFLNELISNFDIEAIILDCIGGLLTKRTGFVQDEFVDTVDQLCGKLDNEQALLAFLQRESKSDQLDSLLSLVIFQYVPNPSLWSGLRYWKTGHKLALVNNGLSRTFRTWANRYGLETIFDVLVNSEEIGLRKSNPQFYLRVAHLLSVPPERCLVIDDDEICLESAFNAGMKTIQTYYQNVFPFPEYKIECIDNTEKIVLEKIYCALRCQGYFDHIDETTSLRSLGLDSLAILILILDLEKSLDIHLEKQMILDDIDKIENLKNVCLTRMEQL